MNIDWKKIKEEPYKAGYRKMLKKTFVLPDGRESDYDVRDEGKTVTIVAFTPENKIILEKLYRPGPEKVLMELPGGFVDKDEEPEDAAKRELLEETGYSGKFEFVGTNIDDAYSNCIRHLYIAKDCQKNQDSQTEEDEFIELTEMSVQEFREHLKTGQLTDVELGYLALDYLKLL